jgi:hypothetical protein
VGRKPQTAPVGLGKRRTLRAQYEAAATGIRAEFLAEVAKIQNGEAAFTQARPGECSGRPVAQPAPIGGKCTAW